MYMVSVVHRNDGMSMPEWVHARQTTLRENVTSILILKLSVYTVYDYVYGIEPSVQQLIFSLRQGHQ